MIQNCRDYNKDPNFIKKYADRFVKEFDWEWSEMGRWMSTERRKLAREAAAPVSAPSATTAAPTTSTSGNERYVLKSVIGLSVDTITYDKLLCILMLTNSRVQLLETPSQPLPRLAPG
jgi:hypothetical protein